MRIALAVVFLAFIAAEPAAFAAVDRTLDCPGPLGTSTFVLDFKQGVATWSTKNSKTGVISDFKLRLSVEKGQYILTTGHSVGHYEKATGELTWFYHDKAFASATCRERN
jgi:hypothetical protein